MQGFFEFVLEGTKEELERAVKVIEEKAKVYQPYEALLKFKQVQVGETELCFGMESSGNVRGIGLIGVEVMEGLCKDFPYLKIFGTDYLLDSPWKDEWVSEVGNSEYEYIQRASAEVYHYIGRYIDEEGNLTGDEIVATCPFCDADVVFTTTFEQLVQERNQMYEDEEENEDDEGFDEDIESMKFEFDEEVICKECDGRTDFLVVIGQDEEDEEEY